MFHRLSVRKLESSAYVCGPQAPAPSVNDVPAISVAHFKRTERLNDRVGEQSVYEPMAVYSNVFRGSTFHSSKQVR